MRPHLPALSAALLAACGSAPEESRRCEAPADCGPSSFCRSGHCVASAAPIAMVLPPSPGHLASHRVHLFDGSLSRDPDPEDQVVSFEWSARRVAAGCDPYVAATGEPLAEVVFGCAGTFEVRLRVADATGLAGETAAPVSVDLSADMPSVAVGPALAVEHRCQGTPIRCETLPPAGEPVLSLSASAASPISSSFTYAWTVSTPAIDPAPRVSIEPPGSPSPAVRIETDGTAIAGDYLFTVVATDAYHLVSVGQQRLSVGNRPPQVAGGGTVSVPHLFDAAGRMFRASGSVSAAAADPDGDPVTSLGFTASHAGDGPGLFALAAGEWAADFAIAVPYSQPSDGLFLVGGAGLSRTITLSAVDANGARAAATWDVQVTNRPPRVSGSPGAVSVGHSFDAAGSRYLAVAPLVAVIDDDGDPISQTGPTGDARCAAIPGLIGGGAIAVECSLPYAGVPAVGPLLGSHRVDLHVGDPWSSISAGTGGVVIGNQAPRVLASSSLIITDCGPLHCCRTISGECVAYNAHHGAGSTSVPVSAADDDGDPIRVTYASGTCAQVTPAEVTCGPGPAPCGGVEASVCAETAACGKPLYQVAVTATDGDASATGTLIIDPGCVTP